MPNISLGRTRSALRCQGQTAARVMWLLLFISLTSACSGPLSPAGAPGPYEGTPLDGPAPDFRLLDQNGARVALSDFPGKAVILTFFDSQCREICPLTAAHLHTAYQALGAEASSVIFLGVNVNLEARAVADVAATTQKWRLDEIPTWHFLTGSAEELERVWVAYNIAVIPASEEGELLHTPGVYLIDQAGRQRWYISTPFDEASTPQATATLSTLLVKHIRDLLRSEK